MKLILASSSPRRQQLLREAGYEFEVIAPDPAVEERFTGQGAAIDLVRQLATAKARDVAQRIASGLVLAADTVAECDGQILGKPGDAGHAGQMLRAMSGREHHVHTGICLWSRPEDRHETRTDTTRLYMSELPPERIVEYVSSGAWVGKAGAFGYQDGLDWVHIIAGSPSNVVGLPMELLREMLAEFEAV
jgi:septum formation protein